MPSLDSFTVWNDATDETYKYTGAGSIKDKDDKTIVSVGIRPWTQSDLPTDVSDWCIVATDADGNHYPDGKAPGEIETQIRSAGMVKLHIPDNNQVQFVTP